MPTYTITEPHPTVATNSFTHSGRGGLGNTFRAPATTSPSGIPSVARVASGTSSGSTGRFYSGRGGAGNAHVAAERATLSFDEELSRAEVREKKVTKTFAGRGGAGNIFSTTNAPKKERKHSSGSVHSTSSRRDSTSTDGSVRSGFMGRLSSTFNRS